jgi:hypothetical protein
LLTSDGGHILIAYDDATNLYEAWKNNDIESFSSTSSAKGLHINIYPSSSECP